MRPRLIFQGRENGAASIFLPPSSRGFPYVTSDGISWLCASIHHSEKMRRMLSSVTSRHVLRTREAHVMSIQICLILNPFRTCLDRKAFKNVELGESISRRNLASVGYYLVSVRQEWTSQTHVATRGHPDERTFQ